MQTLAIFLIICAVVVISLFALHILDGIRVGSRAWAQEQKRLQVLPQISKVLADLPQQDPAGEEFYALCNPVAGTLHEKMLQMKSLRAENKVLLECCKLGWRGG